MASIAQHLHAQARRRLDGLQLRDDQHVRDALVEVEAEDLRALVVATPGDLPAGPAKVARDSWAVGSLASAGRIVSVRADHLAALADVAMRAEAAADSLATDERTTDATLDQLR